MRCYESIADDLNIVIVGVQANNAHLAVDETADSAREMLLELIQTLEDTASASGLVNMLLDNLAKAIARVTPPVNVKNLDNYERLFEK